MTTAADPAAGRGHASASRAWICGIVALGVAAGVRVWNALGGSLGWGYDAWGHTAYVLYLDLYRAVPHADQGWSYFHPPLHYLLSWPFCWLRSGEALLRGMLLLASLASLATALLALRVQRGVVPRRPDLAWLACAAVAFLPAHFTASAMPGNEVTAAFFASAAIAHLILGSPPVSWRRDLVTGALLGLALLAKHSAWVAVLAVTATLATEVLLAAEPWRAAWLRGLRRVAAMALALGVVAGPLLARNLMETGTLVPSSRDDPYVRAAESRQPPGVRTLRHYLRISPLLFRDASPVAPHNYGSVWGSLYANSWFDTHRENKRGLLLGVRTPDVVRAMLGLALLPTWLALLGAGLAVRDVLRGRRRHAYVPLLWLSAGMLAAQALFAWQMPTWAAVKGGYLLPASLAFGLFLARGFEALRAWSARVAAVVLLGLLAVAALAAALASEGLVLPRRGDAPATGATQFYFGEYAAARRAFEDREQNSAGWDVPWLDNQAATWLAAGEPAIARSLYDRAVTREREWLPKDRSEIVMQRRNQLAVATALAGDEPAATALFDANLAQREVPELRANRGVLEARAGRLVEAEADLRRALADDAEMVPAWESLAVVLQRMQRDAEAHDTLDTAQRVACRAPRGYPRGVGSGEIVECGVGRRWLLRLDSLDGGLLLALPDYYREACARLSEPR